MTVAAGESKYPEDVDDDGTTLYGMPAWRARYRTFS
jgi:hypothetical protein